MKAIFSALASLAMALAVVGGLFAGGVWLVGAVFSAYDLESCNRSARICEQWADAHGGKCAECEEARVCRVRGVI